MIEFERISKCYQETGAVVFRDFSAKVDRGEFAVLTGESGSGKTTLLKLLLKDIELDGGRIIVNNKDISEVKQKDIPVYRRNFGVVFQDYKLMADRTVLENIKIAMIATGAPLSDSSTKVWNVAKLLKITDILKKYPKEISGGERQKVCLARALINNPSILLADEPTGNLDKASGEEIMQLFKQLNKTKGITILQVTHSEECAAYGNRIDRLCNHRLEDAVKM